jgi:hypothetical protein
MISEKKYINKNISINKSYITKTKNYQEFLKIKNKIREETIKEHNCKTAGCGLLCYYRSNA